MMKIPSLKARQRGAASPRAQRDRERARATAQAWLPYRDIAAGWIVRRDGQHVGVLAIEPVNLSLLSARETRRRVRALHEALQGIDSAWVWVALPRPIDLDAYITSLEAERHEADGARARLLREYTRYVREIVAGGQAVERRYYMLFAGRDRLALAETVEEARAALERAGLTARRLDDAGLLDLCRSWAHPASTASLHEALEGAFAPEAMLWEGDDDSGEHDDALESVAR